MTLIFVYLLLTAAIVLEIAGSLCLQASQGWSKLAYGGCAVLCYAGAAYLLGLVLKYMSLNVVQAIWSATGTLGVCLIAVYVYHQKLDWAAFLGIALIIVGILLICLKSAVTFQ